MGPKRIDATLGELIVAVTDEVAPLAPDPKSASTLVAYILQDMFLKRHVRFKKTASLRERIESE